MKTRFLRVWMLAAAASLLALSAFPAWGQEALGDMAVVRIRDIAQTLDIIDEWSSQAGQGQPVTLPLRTMLGNTDWLDASKTAVAMISVDQQMPTVYALVPFVKTSQVFQQLTQAQAGPGYYLLAYPPTGPVPGGVAQALLAESGKPAGPDTVSVEIPAASMAAKMESSVAQGMAQMPPPQPGAPEGLSPQDAQLMVQGMLGIFRQMQSLSMGLSLSRSKAALSFEGQAVPGTPLSQAMAQPLSGESRLTGYQPQGAIQYRSRPFDMSGFMDLATAAMGPFYRKMGVDLACFDEPVKAMTGEYAAGVTLEEDSMTMEGIWCVKDPGAAPLLIEKMIQCSVDMAPKVAQTAQTPGAAQWRRGKDSKVSGLEVKGMIADMAMSPQGGQPGIKTMELRMASQDGMIFMASADSRLAQAIRKGKTLKPGKASGPLFTMAMDLGEMLTQIAQSAPGSKIPENLPRAGMDIAMDMAGGKARTEISMNPQEIMEMTQAFAKMAPGAKGAAAASPGQEGDLVLKADADLFKPGRAVNLEPELSPKERLEKDVADLVDKGNLSAMYGGPKAALRAYIKALKLDPKSPAANFAASLAYAELEQFHLAVSYADKALEASPGNPRYLYGRARILLLAGQKDAAMEGFAEASNAGSEDAQNYLDRISAK